MTIELDIGHLVQEARSIADVLATHRVFGVGEADTTQVARAETAAHIAHEKERFVQAVVRHAVDPKAFSQHTLQYHKTGIWIRFNTAADSSRRVSFSLIDVVPAFPANPNPETNPNIDYIALANDIHFVLVNNAQKSETNTLGDDLEITTR